MPLIYTLKMFETKGAKEIKEAVKQGEGDLNSITRILERQEQLMNAQSPQNKLFFFGIDAISFLKGPSLYKEIFGKNCSP